MSQTIPIQMPFRPEVRSVEGNVDYKKFETRLRRIDQLLVQSGVEDEFIERSVKRYCEGAIQNGCEIRKCHIQHHEKQALRALRCTVLICLLGESYRVMSRRLAECPLYRWFCHVENMGETIKVPGKSTLQAYAQWFPAEDIREIVGVLLRSAGDGESELELAKDVELERVWMDSAAVKTNIHFPVDWLLLRDAVRTLIKAIVLIRKHGLKSRMPRPEDFLREMNRLSIEMTHSRRKSDSGRQRKKVLRRMKKMVKVVESHARRYRQLLDQEWEQTDWTRKQAEQVLRRLDGILEQLPRAVKQAHERIIGERKVKSSDKLLSLYERESRVIVRGKAGDRGFDSASNVSYLNARGTFNGICPKNPQELKKRQREPQFAKLLQRRAATEGRIGIFKNVFCGSPMRTKGFPRRDLAIAWRVLAHNLWVLARLPQADAEQSRLAA